VICKRCNIDKDVDNFYRKKKYKLGFDPWCKECCKQSTIEYYNNHKEEESQKHKKHYKLNAIARKQQVYTYKRNRMATDSAYKLRQDISALVGRVLRDRGYTKKSKTFDMLRCTHEELLRYLGPKPEGCVHLDHMCPCSQAQNEAELIKLQHHVNLRWLAADDNLKKSDVRTVEAEQKCRELLGREWREG
jgi:hypothetical protein